MPTIFTRIVNGELPCYKVAETDQYLAFLDIRPCAVGHTLCIPKKEIDYIFDVEDDLLQGLIVFAKKVAKAVEKEVPCLRCGVAVIGLEVPHAHVHLIPMNSMADFNLRNKVEMGPEALSTLADRIASHL
jgi:histidine triad (HIT) family protein